MPLLTHVCCVHLHEDVTQGAPVYVKWDAERLADKANATRFPTEEAVTKDKKKLENYFSFQSLGFQRDPCTLVDIHGRILIWHLPEVLRKWRLVCFFFFCQAVFTIICSG